APGLVWADPFRVAVPCARDRPLQGKTCGRGAGGLPPPGRGGRRRPPPAGDCGSGRFVSPEHLPAARRRPRREVRGHGPVAFGRREAGGRNPCRPGPASAPLRGPEEDAPPGRGSRGVQRTETVLPQVIRAPFLAEPGEFFFGHGSEEGNFRWRGCRSLTLRVGPVRLPPPDSESQATTPAPPWVEPGPFSVFSGG